MPRPDARAKVVLVRGGDEVASWPFVIYGRLDLGAVDRLARLQLAARRLGCAIVLHETCPELVELLDLVGLRLEVGGQPELGEQIGVEEVVEPDDPVG